MLLFLGQAAGSGNSQPWILFERKRGVSLHSSASRTPPYFHYPSILTPCTFLTQEASLETSGKAPLYPPPVCSGPLTPEHSRTLSCSPGGPEESIRSFGPLDYSEGKLSGNPTACEIGFGNFLHLRPPGTCRNVTIITEGECLDHRMSPGPSSA